MKPPAGGRPSSPRAPSSWGFAVRALWLTLSILLLAGCAGPSAQELTRWTLRAEGTTAPVTLPAHLDLPDHELTYALERDTTVPVACRGRGATVALPYFPGRLSLLVDGHDLGPGTSELVAGYRTRGPHEWAIPPGLTNADAIHLELRVEHTYAQSAWFEAAPRLLPGASLDRHTLVVRFFDEVLAAIAVGTMLAIGTISLVLYLLDRHNKDYRALFGAAFSIVWFMLYQSGLTQLAGRALEVPLTGMSVVSAILMLVQMAHVHCGLGAPPRVWRVAWGLYAAVAALCVSSPFHATLVAGRGAVAIVAAAFAYMLRLYYRQWRSPKPPLVAFENLVALGSLSIVVVPDALSWTGFADPLGGVHTASIGLVLYGFAQFFSIARAHQRAQRLGEARQNEILVLNGELRRQVAERSQAMETAFARLGVAPERMHRLSPGDVIDERYAIVRVLGEGAMGIAYEVRRLVDDRRLAMKVLTTLSDARIMARFAREAHIAAKLDHPALVSIVDVSFASSGFMYLILEYVDGASLDRLKNRFGDVDWALPVLADVAEGLAALHAAGVVHRDLKPGNVLLSATASGRARAKIADFGISGLLAEARGGPAVDAEHRSAIATRRLAIPRSRARDSGKGDSSADLTQEGEVIGTPAYMAPELLLEDAPATKASDVFSFGVMAYEMLGGRGAFAIPPAIALIDGQSPIDAVPMATVCPRLSSVLCGLVDRALSLTATERPTAEQLCQALAHARDRTDAAS